MSQLVFNIWLNVKEVGFNAIEGMDLSLSMRPSRQRESHHPSSMSFIWLPEEGVVQTKGGSIHNKNKSLICFFMIYHATATEFAFSQVKYHDLPTCTEWLHLSNARHT